jgi:haloacetate dehalogenase
MISVNECDTIKVDVGATTILLQRMGDGPALLLLHGFPETHLMWRSVAPRLAKDFTVLCPDLRGYGGSGCPPSDELHTPYSKRAMAVDMVNLLKATGFNECMVAGHDRGGRVAYRMALDHPGVVKRLAVLDIIPTGEVWNRADKNIIAFWPWSVLSQPAPLPEQLMMAGAEALIENAIREWGTAAESFPEEIRKAYVECLRDPSHAHAICEEFRAAATIDHLHDNEDRERGASIACPLLALWSAGGPVDSWYNEVGGPLSIWRNWAKQVEGYAMEGGHFFPESNPDQTAAALLQFFTKPT